MTTFADQLRHYRERARLSQSRLADWAGLSHSYVSRLESGARNPTREMVGLLADALELPQIERDRLMESAGFLGEGDTDPDVARFRSLPPEIRRAALDLIERVMVTT